MSDDGLVVDSEPVSMEDLLAAFVADPLVEGEDGEPNISDIDIKKAVLLGSQKFRRNRANKSAQEMAELSNITCLDDDTTNTMVKHTRDGLEQSMLNNPEEIPSTQDFNEYFLQDFFGTDETEAADMQEISQQEISHSRVSSIELLNVKSVPTETHLAEIDRLKSLVLEAQETIIKLLTDRVEDKARLATLEAQVKFLPLQHLGDANAIQLRNEQESLRTQLSEIRHEVQKSEIGKMRNSMNGAKPRPKSLLARIFGLS